MSPIRESTFKLPRYYNYAVCPDEISSCVIATPHPDAAISAWTFYFSAMLYDLLTLSISTYYLLKAKANALSA